ncbi:hypothetical protein D9M71_822290 [compost metagenome]
MFCRGEFIRLCVVFWRMNSPLQSRRIASIPCRGEFIRQPDYPSAPLEARRALVDERLHAFLLVARGEQQGVGLAFQGQAGLQ